MGKGSKQLRLDSDKSLLVKKSREAPDQTPQGGLQVEALRRGVAFAFADMLSWNVHA